MDDADCSCGITIEILWDPEVPEGDEEGLLQWTTRKNIQEKKPTFNPTVNEKIQQKTDTQTSTTT